LKYFFQELGLALKQLFRFIFKSIIYVALFLIVCAIGLAGFMYFTPDDDLLPEVVALFKQQVTVPDEQNGAIYVIGFTSEGDPFQTGLAYKQAYQAASKARADKNDYELPVLAKYLGNKPLTAKFNETDICKYTQEKCLITDQSKQMQIDLFNQENKELIQRYEKLKNYSQFSAPFVFEVETTTYQDYWNALRPIFRFKLMQIAIDLKSVEKQKAAFAALNDEILFKRRLLAQSNTLIDKLNAGSQLHALVRMSSEIVATYPALATAYQNVLASATAPLTVIELSAVSAFEGEFKTMSKVLSQLTSTTVGKSQWLSANFKSKVMGFKINRSINVMYQNYANLIKASKMTAKQVLKSKESPPPSSVTEFRWLNLFKSTNPAGIIILSISDAYEGINYILRLHDLDGYMRLVETQRLIALQKIAKKDIPVFLNKLGPNLQDPYLEAPMAWNAETSTLSAQSKATYQVKQAPSEVKID
jgi:hypothetical protein